MAGHRMIRLHRGHLQSKGTPDLEALHLRDLFEERAGILEFQAGLSREEAERRAFEEVIPRAMRDGAA